MPAPTYDSRVTGPRYWVTTAAASRVIMFRRPVYDPFIRATVTLTWRDILRAAVRRHRVQVTVTVGAPSDLIDDVLDLDANYNRNHAPAGGGAL